MTSKEFSCIRKKLGKTQKQLAELLGSSLKAIHSYEQGWRSIPPHAERQILFLINRRNSHQKSRKKSCWSVKQCPTERKKRCPAWEFQVGQLCWFINGTICEGSVQKDWKEKMKICRSCKVMSSLWS